MSTTEFVCEIDFVDGYDEGVYWQPVTDYWPYASSFSGTAAPTLPWFDPSGLYRLNCELPDHRTTLFVILILDPVVCNGAIIASSSTFTILSA